MSQKRKKTAQTSSAPAVHAPAQAGLAAFLRRVLPHVTGAVVFLICIAFFTGTYDSAHVKLTLLQMGSVLIATLWAVLKLAEPKNPFTRRHWLFLAPLFIYMGWQTLSFLHFPYKLEAAEEFIRLWMYGGLVCLLAGEFTTENIRTVTRWLLAAAWVVCGYGVLQIVNIWLPGADLLPWHGFFGKRIFATLANPNFLGAFLVFTSAIAGAEFTRTRQKSLGVLLALSLVNLIFTESKGAWLAYGVTIVFVIFSYTNYFSSSADGAKFLQSRKKILLCLFGITLLDLLFTKSGTWLPFAAMGFLLALSYCFSNIKNYIRLIAVLCLLAACLIVGIYSKQRFQSVSFRAYTWLSAVEMIKDSPVLGTGPGSFKLVYPAYRRPQIFYIENAHNTETQHAENELLEQAATGGIVGLALALWVLVTLFAGVFKTLPQVEGARQSYLFGYAAALFGLLLHGVVDISMHFASGGILLALGMGSVCALVVDNPPPHSPEPEPAPAGWLTVVRLVTVLAVFAVAGYLVREFYFMMRNMAAHTAGETVLFILAVLAFAACVLGVLYVYAGTLRRTRQLTICAVLLLTLPLYVFFLRVFTANHYYSLGVALVQMGQHELSLGAFNDAISRNPFLAEYRHYRANIFATTLNLSKQFSPARGDVDQARTDYERAIEDFRFVLAHNPNHALLHQDIGQLYYTLAMRQLAAAQQNPAQAYLYQELATENFALAKKAFAKALALDPVNPNTYLLLANMAVVRHDVTEAQHWVDVYFSGPKGVTEPEFLEQHRANPQLRNMQAHVARLRGQL